MFTTYTEYFTTILQRFPLTTICFHSYMYNSCIYNAFLNILGYAAQAASTCNSYLLADWTYTYTDNSGNTACSSSSELSICSQKDTMAFNYTACPQNIMYSGNQSY